jgi:hypothetical protein
MGIVFNSLAKACKLSLMAGAIFLTTGCSSLADDNLQARFMWGPVNEDFGGLPEARPAFNAESKAAALREELLAPVNRYAPSDKDWREVRGTSKGPTIFGARLSFDISKGGSELRLGAVRRGANRTYGPQLIFNMDGK